MTQLVVKEYDVSYIGISVMTNWHNTDHERMLMQTMATADNLSKCKARTRE